MTTIDQLSSIDSLNGGDNFPVFDASNYDARKVSLTVLLAYMQSNLTFSTDTFGDYVTQRASPSATGFSVTITDGDDNDENVHLILTPTAGFAAGTIQLPVSASTIDKQEVLVNCTQAVTTLTTDGNGFTVTGAPTTLAANDFFRLKLDKVSSVWYRVG